ncbi:hypothetical protein [Sinorhizobium meliloti]|uniref:hypothetical protein n=1 Tax=Rhizobium meliloti TaxID=382 RepID=UPI001F440FBB|nr:hypothetical protein [Sinorhizobium meliloti]
MNEYLQEMGAEVKETEWRLGDVVVPQLQVTSPVMFLVQLEDEEWVIEEAEEFSHLAPLEVRAKLSICDARLAFGVELPPKDRTCSGLRLRADELARRLIS